VGLGPIVGYSLRIVARHVGVELVPVGGESGLVVGWWVVGILRIVGLVGAIVAGERWVALGSGPVVHSWSADNFVGYPLAGELVGGSVPVVG
jgi:hypothetical protein